MAMLDKLLEAMGSMAMGLIPGPSASPKVQYLWRVRVGFTVCGTVLGIVVILMLELGVVPTVYGGVATVSQLSALSAQTTKDISALSAQITADEKQRQADRETTLDTRILDLRIRHCAASTPEGRQLYWSKLAPRMDEYTRLTGHLYNLPDCKDL